MGRSVYRNILRWAVLGAWLAGAVQTSQAQQSTTPDNLTDRAAHARPDTARVEALLVLARAYRKGDVTRQFSYANEALALAVKSRWAEGEMAAEEVLGECYIKVMAYNDALLHFNRSLAAAPQKFRRDNERTCLQFMVHCYHMLNSLEQAAAYQKLLLDLTARTGDPLATCNQMSAYAQRLSDLGRQREAAGWLQQDIQAVETEFAGSQKSQLLADLLNTKATVYAKMHRTDSALLCLTHAAVLVDELRDSTLSAYIISTFCDVYDAADNYDSAIYYGRKAVQMGKVLHIPDLQQEYALVLSRLYKKTGQPAAALEFYTVSDSLLAVINNPQHTIDNGMQVAKINMEQQAVMNRLERQSLIATRKTNQAMLAAALVVMLMLIAMLLIIYRSLRQKQRSNKVISQQASNLLQQNEIINGALSAKELMLKETHHRIKNNLQLISSLLELQVMDVGNVQAAIALRTAQRRIQSIATVHSRLHGSGGHEQIELSGFVSDLFARLANAFGADNVTVRIENDIPPTQLPLDLVVLLGLILNELITNTFKHACTDVADPAVGITLTTLGHDHVLQYWDNGPGLAPGVYEAPAGAGSLGLQLIKRLSKQLRGTAKYTYDDRSRFNISFHTRG